MKSMDIVCICVCERVCYSCCGDIDQFTKSQFGDSPFFWGQNASPCNVTYEILRVKTWLKFRAR